jgi:methylenetetrahydrofolate reductase (NADPH)
VMSHLTGVGHSRAELHAILRQLRAEGIDNVMALRGDPPAGVEQFEPHPDGICHGGELIGFIHDVEPGFCVGGAAYPEGHIESENRHVDVRYLMEMQERGAAFFVTQLFFDNACYFDFVERARRAGVTRPILAGIMPIENADQIRRFTQRCGVTIPTRLASALDRCDGLQAVHDLGVAWAIDQCRELLERGAPGIHFYTLNRSRGIREILQALAVPQLQHG